MGWFQAGDPEHAFWLVQSRSIRRFDVGAYDLGGDWNFAVYRRRASLKSRFPNRRSFHADNLDFRCMR